MFENFKTIKEIKKLKKIPVSGDFLFSLRKRLENYMEIYPMKIPSEVPVFNFRYVLVPALIIVLIFGIGSAAFASQSLPGDLFYPVKIFSEDVAGRLITNDEAKIEFETSRLDRRFGEMEKLFEKDLDGKRLDLVDDLINKTFSKVEAAEFEDMNEKFEDLNESVKDKLSGYIGPLIDLYDELEELELDDDEEFEDDESEEDNDDEEEIEELEFDDD